MADSFVDVYGFGSFFSNDEFEDVDLVLVHANAENASCRLAIACKKELLKRLHRAHITMLSHAEERSLNFLVRACALKVGEISNDAIAQGADAIACQLHEVRRSVLE